MQEILQRFSYNDQEIRTVLIDGEPGFVAADIARILEYRSGPDMTRRLDDEDKGYAKVRTPGGEQELTVITESGLYDSIFRSNAEGAKKFRRWVTSEVLPSIRKTGSYGKPAELTRADLAQMVLDAEREKAELEPRAQAWDTLAGASGDYSVEQAAKVLSRDDRIRIGRNRLFEFMGELGWIYRWGKRRAWHAYQDQVDNGRIVLKMSPAFQNAKTGELELPPPTIRLTAKGVEALRTKLLEAVAA